MKNFFLSAAILLVTSTFAQTSLDYGLSGASLKSVATINSDTTLKVSYVKKMHDHRLPAFYLNGRLVNQSFIDTVDPKLIDSINVNKDSLQIGNRKYYGQVHIKTENSYNPKIISLNELKQKHTNLKSEPAIFMVDGEIITSDYDDYVLDENLLWRIFIDKVENDKENINVKFIKVLTKTEENLKKPPVIKIRGTELGLRK